MFIPAVLISQLCRTNHLCFCHDLVSAVSCDWGSKCVRLSEICQFRCSNECAMTVLQLVWRSEFYILVSLLYHRDAQPPTVQSGHGQPPIAQSGHGLPPTAPRGPEFWYLGFELYHSLYDSYFCTHTDSLHILYSVLKCRENEYLCSSWGELAREEFKY